MNGSTDGEQDLLICALGAEVQEHRRARRHGPDNLHIERNLDIRVRCIAGLRRRVGGSPLDWTGRVFGGLGDSGLLKIGLKVGIGVTAAEFDDADVLTGAVDAGREIVNLR